MGSVRAEGEGTRPYCGSIVNVGCSSTISKASFELNVSVGEKRLLLQTSSTLVNACIRFNSITLTKLTSGFPFYCCVVFMCVCVYLLGVVCFIAQCRSGPVLLVSRRTATHFIGPV